MKKVQLLKNKSRIIFFAFSIFLFCNYACKNQKKDNDDDLSKIPVNPVFEQFPPAVGDIRITKLSGNAQGNILLVADFGKNLAEEKFHAIMLDDEKLVLRDDGKLGDEKAGDGKFSIVLKEDLDELQKELNITASVLKQKKDIISFKGRTLQHLPVEKIDFTALDRFRDTSTLLLPPFPFLCSLPPAIDKEKSLMITAASVVEDNTRTFNPCSQTGNANGAWAFPRLITEMANSPATGVSASDFLRHWLETWLTSVFANGHDAHPRPRVNTIINTWRLASGGSFDIRFAPFKLIAIVNRIDLKGNSGYGTSNPGEGRFVFCAIDCNGAILTARNDPGPFMVILEYSLAKNNCAAIKTLGQQWVNLSSLELGSPAYNTALEEITNQYTMANTIPAKPNGSALNQLRTNDFTLTEIENQFWELREFNIDATTHHLKNVTVKQEPHFRYNAVHFNTFPSDYPVLAAYINSHQAAIEANNYRVPDIYDAKNFLDVRAETVNATNYHWNGLETAGTSHINSDSARFIFSLNTCSGCHGGEAATGNFMHVAPGGTTGVPAILSSFLKGNPPLSAGGFARNDPSTTPGSSRSRTRIQ
jgi:hypothetical protein